MSYGRMGDDSDVYVYGTGEHLVCVCTCGNQFRTGSYSEMIWHLKEHQKQGDKVPIRAFMRLKNERKIKGDIYT